MEWTIVKLSCSASLPLIGAAEAKGLRLVAWHASSGQAVVGFCSVPSASKALEPLLAGGSLSVHASEEAARQALSAASGGAASLCAADLGGWLTSAGSPPAAAATSSAGAATAALAASNAASAASTAASAALAGAHDCEEDDATHLKLLALLRERAVAFSELKPHAATRTSEESAALRGATLASGAKAMVLAAKRGKEEKLVLGVIAADRKMDSKAFKKARPLAAPTGAPERTPTPTRRLPHG